jgi:hypothetical protein
MPRISCTCLAIYLELSSSSLPVNLGGNLGRELGSPTTSEWERTRLAALDSLRARNGGRLLRRSSIAVHSPTDAVPRPQRPAPLPAQEVK